MQDCKEKNCNECKKISKCINAEIYAKRKEIDQAIYQRINDAEENKSYLNNTQFMSRYYDKYGYDHRFEFLVDQEIVFVVVIEYGEKIVVTCVSAKTHIVGKNHNAKVRFKKKNQIDQIY